MGSWLKPAMAVTLLMLAAFAVKIASRVNDIEERLIKVEQWMKTDIERW